MATQASLAALNAEQIQALEIVKNGKPDKYRSISYDLSVGHVVLPNGELANRYTLPAQGIVEVISRETLEMPEDVFANVLIKTSLSNDGLLALGIGLVDPGYSGRISSFIVNFSKDPQPIELGQSFLRCVFHKIEKSSIYRASPISDQEYISKSRRRVVSNFSESFLNTKKIANDVVDEAMDKYKKLASFWIPFTAFFLALMTFLLNFGSFAAMQRWIDPRFAVEISNKDEIVTKLDEIDSRLRKIEDNEIEAVDLKE